MDLSSFKIFHKFNKIKVQHWIFDDSSGYPNGEYFICNKLIKINDTSELKNKLKELLSDNSRDFIGFDITHIIVPVIPDYFLYKEKERKSEDLTLNIMIRGTYGNYNMDYDVPIYSY